MYIRQLFYCGVIGVGFISIVVFLGLRWSNETTHMQAFTIVCTTSILADAVRIIGGSDVKVIQLMGPGIDPHLYRPREGDVHRIMEADLVIYHGLHLEGRLATLFEQMNRYVPTYAVSDAVPIDLLRIVDPTGPHYDPHIWHAVPLWMRVIEGIAQQCAQYDPVHADVYMHRAQRYIQVLLELHQWIVAIIAEIPEAQRILITAHDAFGYFGVTYGVQVVALQGISTESDIAIHDVIKLVEYIVQKQVPALFVETAIPHRTLQAVIDAVTMQGHTITLGGELYADALGDLDSGADTYIRMLRHNVSVIYDALKK
jgi:manganese/zinc/iron transport system substrate-binding protein